MHQVLLAEMFITAFIALLSILFLYNYTTVQINLESVWFIYLLLWTEMNTFIQKEHIQLTKSDG